MAAITSTANGSWATPGTWVGGVPPGIGDTAILAHNVTIDADTTFGTSPAAAGNVLTIQTTKTLTLNANMFIRGGFLLEGTAKIIVAAGKGIEFDPSNAASPGTAAYTGIIGNAHNSTPLLQLNGALGNTCYVRTKAGAATAAYAQLTDGSGPWLQAGTVQATYTLFSRLGDAARPAIITSPGAANIFSVEFCDFDNCGEISKTYNIQPGSIYDIKNCRFTNSLAVANVTLQTGGAITTGSRKILDSCFDKTLHFYPAESFTIERNYFNQCFDTTTGDWVSFKGNFVRQSSVVGVFNSSGNVEDSYLFYDDPSYNNPHFIEVLRYGRNQSILGNVFDTNADQPAQEGDCILLSASPVVPCVVTIKNNLIVRGPTDKTVGTLFTALGNANTSIICEHNTIMTGDQGAAVGETYIGFAGMLQSYKSNLLVSKLGGEGFKLYDSGVDDSVIDLVLSANANYNSGFGLLAGSNLKGYNNLEFTSGSPGANDIADGDPLFVQDTRKLTSWSTNLGGPGTVEDALSRLKADRSLIANLVTWVRAGFYVQRAALNSAGHDAVTVGALPFQSSSSMTVLPTSLVADSTGNIVTVTGVGTAWTPGGPGTPAFIAAGVVGAQVTSQVINNPTSATLLVTASTGGNTGTVTISDGTLTSNGITVAAGGSVPVPGKATYWEYMDEWAGYLDTWFINNNHPANDSGLAQTFYDGEMCGYRLKDHFLTADYDNFINEGWLAYTDYYVLPNLGFVQGFRNFTDGELEDVLRVTSRSVDSLDAIGKQLLNGAYVASGDVSDSTLSRECAYAIETHINAARTVIGLTAPQLARLEQLKAWAIGHIDQWCVNLTAPYFRPFMGALTAKALINYYDYIFSDVAIVAKLKILADYAWSTCWKSTAGAWGQANSFLYTDRDVGDPLDNFTQPDLNILICPLWGWLYYRAQGAAYRTNGDQIFQGGIPNYSGAFHVSGAYLGTRSAVNPAGKQYDQQLYWGPRYIEWAEAVQPSIMTVSPVTLNADSINEITVTGTGTAWTPGTPGSPTFTITGVVGAEVISQVVNTATSATLIVRGSTGGNTGTLIISDGSVISNGISVVALNPPGGTNARRRPY